MRFSLALHIIGVVFWLGGLILLPRLMKLALQSGTSSAQLKPIGKRAFFGYLLPGAIITVVSGLYQLFSLGASLYFKQGWFHTKLTFVVVLLIATALLWIELRREQLRGGRLMMIHGIGAAMLLIVVFLTFLSRP